MPANFWSRTLGDLAGQWWSLGWLVDAVRAVLDGDRHDPHSGEGFVRQHPVRAEGVGPEDGHSGGDVVAVDQPHLVDLSGRQLRQPVEVEDDPRLVVRL